MIRESRLYINGILLYITYVPWYNHDHGHDHDTSNQCSVKSKTGTMIFPWLYHDFPSVTLEMLTPNNKCFPSPRGIVVMTVYLYAHLDVVIITNDVWAHKNANTIMQSLRNTRVICLFWNTRDHFSMGSAIERRRYHVTSSLIGLAHSQNDPRTGNEWSDTGILSVMGYTGNLLLLLLLLLMMMVMITLLLLLLLSLMMLTTTTTVVITITMAMVRWWWWYWWYWWWW